MMLNLANLNIQQKIMHYYWIRVWEVLNVISDQFYDGKSKVQNGLVPMDMVLDYFNIPNYKHGEIING